MKIKYFNKSITAFLYISFPLILCNTVYAITDSEILAEVANRGKESVSGNVFLWFLCAVAFLKISQKIDSFMSGLGVNVGHTGGSLLSEAMIAAKSLGMGGKGFLNKGFGGGSSQSGGSGNKGGFLSGGLAGVVGRRINSSAMNAATDKGGGFFGKKAFESSLKNNGEFAKDVIGKVAKGDIAKDGSITGETADKALSAYLGYDSAAPDLSAAKDDSSSIPIDADGTDSGPGTTIPTEATEGYGGSIQPDVNSVSGVGVQYETKTAPETSVESGPETPQGEEYGINTESIPMESIPESSIDSDIPDAGCQSETQTETGMIDSEQAALTETGESIGISDYPGGEIASDSAQEDNNPVSFAGAAEQDDMIQNSMSTETSIALSDISDGIPELPEIVPDDYNAQDSAHPVSFMSVSPVDTVGYTSADETQSEAAKAHALPSGYDAGASEQQPNVSDDTAAASSAHMQSFVAPHPSTGSEKHAISQPSNVSLTQPAASLSANASHVQETDSVQPAVSQSASASSAQPGVSQTAGASMAQSAVSQDSAQETPSSVQPVVSQPTSVSSVQPVVSQPTSVGSVQHDVSQPTGVGSVQHDISQPTGVSSAQHDVSQPTSVSSAQHDVSQPASESLAQSAVSPNSAQETISSVQPAVSQHTNASLAQPAGTGLAESVAPPAANANPAHETQSGATPFSVTLSETNDSGTSIPTQSNSVTNTASTGAEIASETGVPQKENTAASVSVPTDNSVSAHESSTGENTGVYSDQAQPLRGNALEKNAINIPIFSDVEIGGGRITGIETSEKFPTGIEFGMYNTAQYMKPDGEFTTVKTVDGAKWYKQYAIDKAERSPIVEETGKIKYVDKILKKMPPVPRRKGRG